MTMTSCTTELDHAHQRRERAGWLAAWALCGAAVVSGLYAVNQLAALPSCEPLHRTAPRGDAGYADALMARDWNAAIASESRLGLAAGRVRNTC